MQIYIYMWGSYKDGPLNLYIYIYILFSVISSPYLFHNLFWPLFQSLDITKLKSCLLSLKAVLVGKFSKA